MLFNVAFNAALQLPTTLFNKRRGARTRACRVHTRVNAKL